MNEVLIHNFGHKTIERGINYFQQGKVQQINIKNGCIHALVQGNYSSLYHLTLPLDRNNTVDVNDSECSCPVGYCCKHMVAVILTYQEQQNKAQERKKSVSTWQAPEHTERVVSVQIDSLKSLFDSQDITHFLNSPNVQRIMNPPKRKEQWQVRFTLYIHPNLTHNSATVSPRLEYIKKDGTPGRLQKYNADKLSVPLTATEKKVLKLLEAGDNSAPLYYVLPNFLEENAPVLGFFAQSYDQNSYIPAAFHKITQIDINFELKTQCEINEDEEKLRFNYLAFYPIITLKAGEKQLTFTNLERAQVGFTADLFIAADKKTGDIFYAYNFIDYSTILQPVFHHGQDLTFKDIQLIREQFSHDGSLVQVHFDYEDIYIHQRTPSLVVEVREHRRYLDSCNIVLSYDYNLDYPDHKDEKKILHTVMPDDELEKKAKQYLKEIVDEDLDKNYWKYPLTSGILEIDVSIPEFLRKYGPPLIESGFSLKVAQSDKLIRKSAGKVKVNITSGTDWFEIETSYEHKDGSIQNLDIQDFDFEKNLIETKTNYLYLSAGDLEKLKNLVEMGMSPKGTLKIAKTNLGHIEEIYKLVETTADKEFESAYKVTQKLKNLKSHMKQLKAPKEFTGTLRPYQQGGYQWLTFMKDNGLNGCLADDMGLGKTVQMLAFLQKQKEEGYLNHALLIVPVSTIYNWENEIEKFTPRLSALCHYGGNRQKGEDFHKNSTIIIVSYHTLRQDIAMFKNIEWDFIILDEAQNIKNAQSQIFKAVRALNGKHRFTLTGTPLENTTLDLWSQMDFLNPGLLGTMGAFKKNFANKIEKNQDKDAASRLKKLVFPFILRRKKEDVAKDLPPKEEILIYCEMDGKQRAFYNELAKHYKERIKGSFEAQGKNKSSAVVFEGLLRLRQAVLFPGLVSDEYAKVPSCKFENLRHRIDELHAENNKSLIFSQFVGSLKNIEKHLAANDMDYCYLDGQTKNRQQMIDDFQNRDDRNFFLISLKAGGVGINLTAADYVILFDPWWNPAAENQAVDRAHRIGRKKKVIIYKMIVKDSIEEKILALQEKKKTLVSEIVTNEKGFYKSMDENDIIGLFDT